MAQTKADRQEAAKKAAATRERNRTRSKSSIRGTKAASSRQGNAAADSFGDVRRALGNAGDELVSAAKSAGAAAKEAGKSAATRAKALGRG
jgi:hypothetical protein